MIRFIASQCSALCHASFRTDRECLPLRTEGVGSLDLLPEPGDLSIFLTPNRYWSADRRAILHNIKIHFDGVFSVTKQVTYLAGL